MTLLGLYRRLFCRGGFGVHSPFVFDLITNVIEERCEYYFYDDIYREYLRRKSDGRCDITQAEGRLLFRLANRFHPRRILIVGEADSFAAFCLSGYAPDAVALTAIADGDEVKGKAYDCIFFSCDTDCAAYKRIVTKLRTDGFAVVAGIRKSGKRREAWTDLCGARGITASIDLCSMGLLVANPRLQRRRYKSVVGR